jgi:chlorite dismutase
VRAAVIGPHEWDNAGDETPMSANGQNGQNGLQEIAKGQFVHYAFYKIDPAWRLLPAEEQTAQKAEFVRVVEAFQPEIQIRSYTLAGIRADADLLLWCVAPAPDAFQRLGTAIFSTTLGPYLRQAYAYLAMTKRSIYVTTHRHEGQDGMRLRISPAGAKYLFVYPFVKTRPWYQLSLEERQRLMAEHIRIGHKYPSVKLNTTYSFGLDDQEFVVAFETDVPSDFVDLVMELREVESSLYTLRDTPIFTCIAMSLPDALESLGGAGARAALPVAL